MRWHNYDFLNSEENYQVNLILNKVNGLLAMGLITLMEANYTFQKQIMDIFNRTQSFNICTNREMFQVSSMD